MSYGYGNNCFLGWWSAAKRGSTARLVNTPNPASHYLWKTAKRPSARVVMESSQRTSSRVFRNGAQYRSTSCEQLFHRASPLLLPRSSSISTVCARRHRHLLSHAGSATKRKTKMAEVFSSAEDVKRQSIARWIVSVLIGRRIRRCAKSR